MDLTNKLDRHRNLKSLRLIPIFPYKLNAMENWELAERTNEAALYGSISCCL